MIYNSLQMREIFHLEFLRWLSRKLKPQDYALKGGANLRFFFKSLRYSEDMDLDAGNVKVFMLRDIVMKTLCSELFQNTLKSYEIIKIIPPDTGTGKQTETTQRFKIHLLTRGGENLFTKIEFSRRGFKGNIITGLLPEVILREYRMPPLVISHYDIESAIVQKIETLATRTMLQARDIFDLYALSLQTGACKSNLSRSIIQKAYDRIFEVTFEQFRDTVILYLSPDDQAVYNNPLLWDEIKLKLSEFLKIYGEKCK